MGNSASTAEIHAAIACLGRLTEVFERRRQELAASVGLTEQQWSVLDEIEQEHFMPSLFARRRDSSAAAVSKILRQLQDKELVVVSLRSGDARQRHYELSPRKSGNASTAIASRASRASGRSCSSGSSATRKNTINISIH